MSWPKKIFRGQTFIKFALAVVFTPIGFSMGFSILGLRGSGLLMFIGLLAFVGYSLPPILGKIGARAIAHFIEKISLEVAHQLKVLVPKSWLPAKRIEPDPTELGEFPCPALILDTSAIIDGRIGEIAQSGFLHGRLVVPKFVLAELQRVADSPDRIHRERGRRGLEILENLKKTQGIVLVIRDKGLPRGKEVDDRLIKLARQLSGQVVTTDYNLNKVARVSGIRVLNVNELANALRPLVVPGQSLAITVVQLGKEPGQGVGYLEDGTMIVVEDGEKLIGQEVTVVISRFLQTAAGRMIFARQA